VLLETRLLLSEFNWQENFNIKASKNNIKVHKNF